jgi:hypothetical protein
VSFRGPFFKKGVGFQGFRRFREFALEHKKCSENELELVQQTSMFGCGWFAGEPTA